jgi:hypothetical protein
MHESHHITPTQGVAQQPGILRKNLENVSRGRQDLSHCVYRGFLTGEVLELLGGLAHKHLLPADGLAATLLRFPQQSRHRGGVHRIEHERLVLHALSVLK